MILVINSSNSSIENKIIVKVGKEIITLFELENKINTTLILTNQEINQKNINKIKNLTLKKLIDNKLKQNELKKYGLKKKNKSAIDSHMKRVSKNLNVKYIDLKNFFKLNNIDYDTYIKEVETEYLWQRLIVEIYSSKIKIDDKDIYLEANDLINKKVKVVEFKLAEIEVNFEGESKIDLINEIKESINSIGFSNTAKKYSISSSALTGGKIGWINSNSINNNLIGKLINLNKGEISDEIISTNNLIFYKMLDRRVKEISDNLDIKKIKDEIIAKKQNDLLNLYSSSHLSKKKNNTSIEIQ